jgi:hypothetical protein
MLSSSSFRHLYGGDEVRILSVLLLTSAFYVSIAAPAHAYIDPGSGSVITSAIIGFFAAVAYTGRKYFYRLKDAVFGKASSRKASSR